MPGAQVRLEFGVKLGYTFGEVDVRGLKLAEDVRPVSDLKAHGGELLKQVVDTGRPIVLSRHGRAVAVLVSVADFDEYQAFAEQRSVRRAVEEAERDVEAGRVVPHDGVKKRLDEWANGD